MRAGDLKGTQIGSGLGDLAGMTMEQEAEEALTGGKGAGEGGNAVESGAALQPIGAMLWVMCMCPNPRIGY